MNLLSINDITKNDVLNLFSRSDAFRKQYTNRYPVITVKSGGLLFFQASTRTRVGFETASWRLGYKTTLLGEAKPSISVGWSETMSDTIRTMNAYVDFYFVRHSSVDIFAQIVPNTKHPVINCGNGYDEHPTQALIDAYTIWQKFGRLDNLNITLIGDLKYSRAAHSLMLLLAKFSGNVVNQICPSELSLTDDYISVFTENNQLKSLKMSEIGEEQVLYSAGFPPINPSGTFSQNTVRKYIVTKKIADSLKDECIIMSPLPRIDEIDVEVDNSSKSHYFQQNELGLYVRMAIVDKFCLDN